MDQERFIAASKHLKEIKRLTTLLKGIKTNVLIRGEPGTGKSFIARQICPKAVVADGANPSEVTEMLKSFDGVIIENFDMIRNYNQLSIDTQRIVGITTAPVKPSVTDKFFGMTIEILPLRERPEEILPFARLFLEEAQKMYNIMSHISVESMTLDISENYRSLRRSIVKELLLANLAPEEMEGILEQFMARHSPPAGSYDHFLALFDRAIIHASHRLYGSQLSMAAHMGINRNTLRKKVKELGICLERE